eukprot:gnl/TRDRNA2_/TRDRNA2_162280_c0_seq2.p1 gnl/TRDRNA2_/TRDRNA2_162280_c0~~gnl/TRDRNA2_/TRDRNA2_162280_c0_seq2.p1  ORF type:complete len:578 (-),score=72.37 gnl/TRDRNA2_/TRDRNA2_162280_c0_seq2:80-1813(-)
MALLILLLCLFALSNSDSCADYRTAHAACPSKVKALHIQDVNIVVTTDLHSWIDGRPHQPHLNATIADMVNAVEYLREAAAKLGKDVFVFDNGDINDGTGLSSIAGNHIDYLAPLLRQVPYDALNCGNHELYQRGDGKNNLCPITGLQQSGYIKSWKGRYLTSNIVMAGTDSPVGERFVELTGKLGTKLLVFGFLYNMPDHCPPVDVQKVESVVQSSWFLEALDGPGIRSHAIVVLAHMDADDPLVSVIHKQIRSHLPNKPVQFITGHSHQRKFTRLDGLASSYEAGCKLDTVGYISFPLANNEPADAASWIPFDYVDIDGNTAALAQALNLSVPSAQAWFPPVTPQGATVAKRLNETQQLLGLSRQLGMSTMTYKFSDGLEEASSLYGLYVNKIVPSVLFSSKHGAVDPSTPSPPQWFVIGTSALTYDIYEGPVTVDDCYKASPYANFFYSLPGVPGRLLEQLLTKLNSASWAEDAPCMSKVLHRGDVLRCELGSGRSFPLPNYVATQSHGAGSDVPYDIIYCDFDSNAVEDALIALGWSTNPQANRTVYMPGVNDTSVLLEYFAKQSVDLAAFSP